MTASIAYPSCFLMPEMVSQQSRHWPPLCRITYRRDAWVKLWQSPSAYAAAEAKLLCQEGSGVWIAWVPNYGEVVLDKSQFYG